SPALSIVDTRCCSAAISSDGDRVLSRKAVSTSYALSSQTCVTPVPLNRRPLFQQVRRLPTDNTDLAEYRNRYQFSLSLDTVRVQQIGPTPYRERRVRSEDHSSADPLFLRSARLALNPIQNSPDVQVKIACFIPRSQVYLSCWSSLLVRAYSAGQDRYTARASDALFSTVTTDSRKSTRK